MRNDKHLPLKKAIQARMRGAEFRFYFHQSKAVSGLCRAVAEMRQRKGMTQAELAKVCETTQSVIARLENGNDGRMPSLDLLNRVAGALKLKLVVGFEAGKAA